MFKDIFVVIPSLDPDEKLKKTVDGLKAVGFCNFVLVDDGSKEENQKHFPFDQKQTILLRHKVNKGKGAALKTAFYYINENYPTARGVVTVDGDGQHTPNDVKACVEALDDDNTVVLGCRDFSLPNVPPKSRFGNKITSRIFKIMCGLKVSDTQTGLRAFPISVLKDLLNIKGNRFEYETNMLLKFGQMGIVTKEVKIETVYFEDNRATHFKPIKDSIRIYRFILAYILSSFVSFVADISIFYLICRFLSVMFGHWAETVATVVARIFSSILNYTLNRKKVFDSVSSVKNSLIKYYALSICQTAISAGLVTLGCFILNTSLFGSTIVKIVVDTILFFISYRIQRCWVFCDRRIPKNKKPIKPLTFKRVVLRSLLVIFTSIMLAIITIASACTVICYGPSESLRNMLVLSAKQASATKWIPHLFMPNEMIEKILQGSNQITVDSMPVDDYLDNSQNNNVQVNEWEDAIDGMKLVFLEEPRFKAYLLMIKNPERVSVGISSDDFSTATNGMRMFDLVKKYDAVAAINAGEFLDIGGTGTGAQPIGLTYSAGQMVWNDNQRRTFIGFDKDNRLICDEYMTEEKATELGIRDAVCFQKGNVLIRQDGDKIKLLTSNKNIGTAQRTAIGQRADGTVLFLVTDGRTAESIGATRDDVIGIMARYNAVSAAMLDGGSSAMLYYEKYFNKYNIDINTLDAYQKRGLVNRYKAFMQPRKMPTFFIVSRENDNG